MPNGKKVKGLDFAGYPGHENCQVCFDGMQLVLVDMKSGISVPIEAVSEKLDKSIPEWDKFIQGRKAK